MRNRVLFINCHMKIIEGWTQESFYLFVSSRNILFREKLQNYLVINLKLLVNNVARNYSVRSRKDIVVVIPEF